MPPSLNNQSVNINFNEIPERYSMRFESTIVDYYERLPIVEIVL